jgi:hypothetical protein
MMRAPCRKVMTASGQRLARCTKSGDGQQEVLDARQLLDDVFAIIIPHIETMQKMSAALHVKSKPTPAPRLRSSENDPGRGSTLQPHRPPVRLESTRTVVPNSGNAKFRNGSLLP